MLTESSDLFSKSGANRVSLMWRQSRETCSPKDGERRQLLKVKWEVQAETGLKESSDGL